MSASPVSVPPPPHPYSFLEEGALTRVVRGAGDCIHPPPRLECCYVDSGVGGWVAE